MALPASSHSAPTYSSINPVPLRVNVVSDDHSVSIVETLVLDRNCWPVPLFDPLEKAIDQNADELAYVLLSDLEVHGMGRTVRHFTGRVELWSAALQQKIRQQLIPQLRHVARTTKLRVVKKELSSPTTNRSEAESSKKRKADQQGEKSAEEEAKKEEPQTVVSKKRKKASLVPVRLRLCVNGTRIHDDFIWDLSVPQCPIEFAKSLGEDLNLPDEAIAAVVTSIVEQLDGSTVDDTKDLDKVGATAALRKSATAAWSLEHRVHMANMQQLLTLHRPTTSSTTTSATPTSSHHAYSSG